MIAILLIIIGFVFLIKGAEYLIDGASSIAHTFRISDLVIGLTIVAFGTSAPELFVNIIASIRGNADIAVGNIVGSTIANVFLVLGIAALLMALPVQKGTVWREIPLSLLAALVLGIMVNDELIDNSVFSGLSRIDGVLLLLFFCIFIAYTYAIAKVRREVDGVPQKQYPIALAVGYVVLGGFGLLLGGKWVVEGAVSIAVMLGVSESLIGFTIVAVGTCLPELVTSIVAARKQKADIAVGNVVGSNIFNIFFVLGISSCIAPIPFQTFQNVDILVMISAHILLFACMFSGNRNRVDRGEGILFLLLYAVYIGFLISRG